MPKISKTVILVISFLISHSAYPQGCAMCKASLEASIQSGGEKGAGINERILYLMSMPYIALLLFATFWYIQNRKKIKNN